MRTELYWIEAPRSGRLAIMPRPRGGDWLDDEVQAWRNSGVDTVVSLLTEEETNDLDLREESAACQAKGIQFLSYPITDRSVPSSRDATTKLLAELTEQLTSGRNVAIHCRQGIGRAALMALGLLVMSGMPTTGAIQLVSTARGCPVPETAEQTEWITDFANQWLREAT
jgi:protein-tyrosine phosphatase